MFPKVEVRYLLVAPNSDLCPHFVRPFRFKTMWIKEPSSSEVVEDAWQVEIERYNGFVLQYKLLSPPNMQILQW